MPKVAIVGAGGLVGTKLISYLDRSGMPELDLLLTGGGKSVGTEISYRGKSLRIQKNAIPRLRSSDIVVLCTPTGVSKQLVCELRGGPVVVDTSSAFRMDSEVPLIVPEVNGHALKTHKGLIAGPNCSTIQLVMVLKPILDAFGLKRVHVATYQSVSGLGYQAVCQLEEESVHKLCPEKPGYASEPQFPHEIAFNVIPQVDSFMPDGYTKEEMKMVNESRKILGVPDLLISCTCVRVPVFVGHCEECLVDTVEEADPAQVRTLLSSFPGIIVMDEFEKLQYPMPCIAQDKDEVYVGRIRKDLSSGSGQPGLLLWIVADNLLRGAATNAGNIIELLLD